MAKQSGKRGKLHPVSFQRFVEEVHANPQLKAQVIAELERFGFSAFAERHFDLITRQKKELATIKGRDSEAVITDGVILALHRKGKLELNHEGHNPPNLRMEIYFNGDEVGVRISC